MKTTKTTPEQVATEREKVGRSLRNKPLTEAEVARVFELWTGPRPDCRADSGLRARKWVRTRMLGMGIYQSHLTARGVRALAVLREQREGCES